MDGEALVRDYLGRLEAASWPLDPGRRVELRAEVAEHIEVALAEAGSRDEVAVRNVLERLGQPEEIAAADAEPMTVGPHAMSPQVAGRTWGAVEILAILFLTVGAPPADHRADHRARVHVDIAAMDDAAQADRDADRCGPCRRPTPRPRVRHGRHRRTPRSPPVTIAPISILFIAIPVAGIVAAVFLVIMLARRRR